MQWLLKTIGASDEFVTHIDDVSLAVQRPAVLWLLALLVPVGYFIYRRQRENLVTVPRKLCVALTATRVIVLAIMILVLAGPYLKLDHQLDRRPIVALLIDHSQSMQLPAGPYDDDAEAATVAAAAGYQTPEGQVDAEARKALNRISRVGLAHAALDAARQELLAPLAEKYDLRCYAFSRELENLSLEAEKLALPDAPATGGSASYVGAAVESALAEAGGRPVAGIVLLSDGVNTGGSAPSEAALAAARLKAPIFAVPIGVSTRKSDVAILDVFTSGLVSVGDTARVAVTLQSQGFDSRPIVVELREGETVLDTSEVTLRNEQQQVELTFEATTPGPRYLTVVAPAQPEEAEELRGNNTDTAFLRVSDEKIRVLFVDGLPRWDFRFLKNAMRRDSGLGGRGAAADETTEQPDVLVEAELKRRADGAAALPGTLDELAAYHTVVLGDVSPELLAGGFLELLVQAVRERGLGLIVAAGPRNMPHRFGSEMTDLLPVKLEPRSRGVEADVYNPFRLKLTPEGGIHEAMRLYDEPGRNDNVWSQMPPYFWCAAAQRAAPAATVLAVNPNRQTRFGPVPLVAWHFAGEGKVMFVGTDSTWLWRQNVGDRFFYRFWGQSIRFVARREEDLKHSFVEVRPLRAQPGEEARIELTAVDGDGSPRTERALPVTIAGEGDVETVELLADPAVKGRYLGGFTPAAPGTYRVTFSPGRGAEAAEAQFRVAVAPEELRHPHVDREALDLLASASGGRLVELNELAGIADDMQGETKQIALHREATMWDNWLVLVLLVFVYSLDVGLRRLAGLS